MEDAKQRKARLKALQKEAGEGVAARPEPTEAAEPSKPLEKSKKPRGTSETATPALKFRNYNVRDKEKIQHTVLEPAKPPEFKPQAVSEDVGNKPEDLISTIVDKKPNQDLRRDVEKALAKLDRRTQRALVQIAQSQAIESES